MLINCVKLVNVLINMVKTIKNILERTTSQKRIILNYLKGVKTHPTADDVYREVRKKLPQISQATVYRILNNLKDKNEAQIILSKNTAHFDGDISMHAHFICNKCEGVYDILNECSNCSVIKNQKIKVGKINGYMIYFYGICNKCKK
ncbi:MAG: Ferric uptake regulator, Fur family [Parcubacteria group bacterium GW2011_GWC2_32_10]|nr:MAG: Ferric uptake regulator, Fur family [Parcubacteria group bacterium GW2011_GWC2_32_10]